MFIQCNTYQTVPTTTNYTNFAGGYTSNSSVTFGSFTSILTTGSFSTLPVFSTFTFTGLINYSTLIQVTQTQSTNVVTGPVNAGIIQNVTANSVTNSETIFGLISTTGGVYIASGFSSASSSTGLTIVNSYTENGFTWRQFVTLGTSWSSGSFLTITVITQTSVTTRPTSSSAQATSSHSGSTTTSTSSSNSASNTNFSQTMLTAVTGTTTAVNSWILTTYSAGATATRWSAAGGSVFRTTYATTTVSTSTTTYPSTVTTTQQISYNRTQSITAVLAYNQGTAFLCTGNGARDDLFASCGNTSPGLVAGWNFAATTAATIWAQLPNGTAGPVTTLATSAIAHPGSITFATSSSYIGVGLSYYTTTTTSAVVPFAGGGDLPTSQAPLSTAIQTVTTFSVYTSTFTAPIVTPFNTSLSAGVQTTRSSLSVATSNGSLATTFTLTTAVPGYTTASAGYVVGGRTLISTFLVSGPGLSFTTTTATCQWFYDWSCPTMLIASTIATTSSSSTRSGSSTSTGISGLSIASFMTSNAGGAYTGPISFTQNLYAQPYLLGWNLSTFLNGGGPYIGVANVAIWSAVPFMQGFIPWTATTASYMDVAAPAGFPLQFGAAESAQPEVSASSTAITTTAWGLWGLVGNPHTTTFTTTSTAGTSTITFTGTTVDSFTSSASYGAASGSVLVSVAFPTNMAETAASISLTSTYTLAGTPSTSTSSATYLGFTYQRAQTMTFVESVSLNTTGGPAIPGVGGYAKLGGAACTLWCMNAAVSFFWDSTSTMSMACANLMEIVIGGGITASSSTTSNAGAGSYAVYYLPGQASIVTSPCYMVTTVNSVTAPAMTAATEFWLTPAAYQFPPAPQND